MGRISPGPSVYARHLEDLYPSVNASIVKGILEAARTDFVQGYLVDHKLLISAEVFSDLLVQAEVLLENEYKDAAAVIIRAVLEDGLRRLCIARGIAVEARDTIGPLNDKLYRARVYSVLQNKEITAKAQVGNDAAHGKFDQYTKADVESFLAYVQRFLAEEFR